VGLGTAVAWNKQKQRFFGHDSFDPDHVYMHETNIMMQLYCKIVMVFFIFEKSFSFVYYFILIQIFQIN
jgi:hypothetical protein